MGTTAARVIGATAVAAAMLLTVAHPAAATAERACGPVALGPVGSLPVLGGDAELSGPPGPPTGATDALDMDGDQVADAVTVDPDAATITVARADGTLVLTDVPPETPVPDYPLLHGRVVVGDDLDGDGRDELVVVTTVAVWGGLTSSALLIVRGTTPPGTVATTDVALAVGGRLSGDVDGDGRDDIERYGPAIAGFRFPSEWRSGTGAVSGPDPTAFAPTTLRVGGLVDLDGDGADDRLVLGSVDGTTGASVELAGGASLPVTLPTIPHYAVVRRTDVHTEVVFSWLVSGGPGGIEAAGAEVADTCAEPWMRDAAALVLGRAPGAADYPTFGPLDRPDRTARLERARALVRSQTGRGHQVDEAFAWFLDRPADPVGRAFWVNQLRSGRRRVEHLMVELLGSGEHYRATGATPEAWVDDAYQRLYGRTADPGGRAYWIRQVAAHGTGRTAARMFGEPEAHRFVVARVAGDDDAFGPGVDASVLRPGEAAFAVGGYDGFVADLVASADLYLLANERHRLVGS